MKAQIRCKARKSDYGYIGYIQTLDRTSTDYITGEKILIGWTESTKIKRTTKEDAMQDAKELAERYKETQLYDGLQFIEIVA